jgi:hypothetical protein
MKLVNILEAIFPVSRGQLQDKPYNVFVDLDGVLTDLASGVSKTADGTPNKISWKKPSALVAALDNSSNYDQVLHFYVNLPKTKECDKIWAAANELGASGKVTILTASPKDNMINQDAVRDGKITWCKANLNPRPSEVLVVPHGKKASAIGRQLTEFDVLIDDSDNNIKQWIEAGGTAIPHIPGNPNTTIRNLKTPGKLGVEIDLSIDRAKEVVYKMRDLFYKTGLDLDDATARTNDAEIVSDWLASIGGLAGQELSGIGTNLVQAIRSGDGETVSLKFNELKRNVSKLAANEEGFSTKFSERAGVGKEFKLGGRRYSLSIRQSSVVFSEPSRLNSKHKGNTIKIPVIAPYSSNDDLFKYLIGVMKKEYGRQSDLAGFVEMVASAISNYWT